VQKTRARSQCRIGLNTRSKREIVHARMSAVRQRDTKPERAVRGIVHSLGVRYRVSYVRLPGRPDLVNTKKAWCIFVHGCFWHGHGCARGRLPKSNLRFWRPKIESNRLRDENVLKQLEALGYRVLVIWQCELAERSRLRARLAGFLGLTKRTALRQ
jgi:DNA mismatch endonuclease (patch repair protein)